MSAVVVSIDYEAGLVENLNQLDVTTDVFTEAVRDLHHAAGRALGIPKSASDGQTVLAGEVEFLRWSNDSGHGMD